MLTSTSVRTRGATTLLPKMALGEQQQPQSGPHNNSNEQRTQSLASLAAPRVSAVAALLLVLVWVHSLGGLATHPDVGADGSSSTDRLFNWHPVLMTLGYGVFMTEAVLAYKAPLSATLTRPQRKRIHWTMHSLAVACVVLGFLAAYKSHTLKVPPIPNFYSPHSFMGLAAMLLLAGQYGIGFAAYLWPTISLEQRQALGPLHRFWGLAVYGSGMTAAAIGLQEKATFLQAFGQKGVYSAFVRLPAVAELLLLGTALLVLWQYTAPSAGSSGRRASVHYGPVQADEDTAV